MFIYSIIIITIIRLSGWNNEKVTHLLLYQAETRADEHLEQMCDRNPTKQKYQTMSSLA